MIVITGATGKLGRHVVEQLLASGFSAKDLAVTARDPAKAADFAARGVTVRQADYTKPDTLKGAFEGAEKVLLISANEIGKRKEQHQAVVDAAKAAGVKLLAYTSLLHADRSSLSLAEEHKATEDYIRTSGLPYVFLRNGWYLENYTENLGSALEHGALLGCAQDGLIAAAARADFAAAAVRVLTEAGHENKVYELAGSVPFTMAQLAEEVSRQSGRTVVYKDMPQADYEGALLSFGLPPPVAAMLASADAGIARGDLNDTSGDLERLIGRKTTPLADAVAAALK